MRSYSLSISLFSLFLSALFAPCIQTALAVPMKDSLIARHMETESFPLDDSIFFPDDEFYFYSERSAHDITGTSHTAWTIAGRIMTTGYAPFTFLATAGGIDGRMVATVKSDSIFKGVDLTALRYYYNMHFVYPQLERGARLLATDGTGVPLIARNSSASVIALNLFPGKCCGGNNEEFYQLIANILTSLAGGNGTSVSLAIVNADLPESVPTAALNEKGNFKVITSIDARHSTPSLSELRQFDVILAYTNSLPANRTALGDVLADYVDEGGKLVIAVSRFTIKHLTPRRHLHRGYLVNHFWGFHTSYLSGCCTSDIDDTDGQPGGPPDLVGNPDGPGTPSFPPDPDDPFLPHIDPVDPVTEHPGAPVPEPGTSLLFGSGLIAIILAKRRMMRN